jgi:hypothetical protein
VTSVRDLLLDAAGVEVTVAPPIGATRAPFGANKPPTNYYRMFESAGSVHQLRRKGKGRRRDF